MHSLHPRRRSCTRGIRRTSESLYCGCGYVDAGECPDAAQGRRRVLSHAFICWLYNRLFFSRPITGPTLNTDTARTRVALPFCHVLDVKILVIVQYFVPLGVSWGWSAAHGFVCVKLELPLRLDGSDKVMCFDRSGV